MKYKDYLANLRKYGPETFARLRRDRMYIRRCVRHIKNYPDLYCKVYGVHYRPKKGRERKARK